MHTAYIYNNRTKAQAQIDPTYTHGMYLLE